MSIFGSCTLPPIGEVSICERNTEIHTENTRKKSKSITVQEYSRIVLLSDVLHSPQNLIREKPASHKSAFIEPENRPVEKLLKCWSSGGTSGVLEELLAKKELPSFVHQVLLYSKIFLGALQQRWSILQGGKISLDENFEKYLRVPEWGNAPVRAFACHPLVNRVAVALQDNTVKIICVKSDSQAVIKEKKHKDIYCMAWRPLSACHLAVGCDNGVFLWFLDPSIQASRPNASQLRILSHPGHTPVTELSWSPHGYLLASISPKDSSVLIWNVTSCSPVALNRLDQGNGFLTWSLCGQKLLTCSVTNSFRVWDTFTWKSEKWANLNGRCQAACWSPTGDILVFAVENEPCLYYVQYHDLSEENKTDIIGNGIAVKCCDLSATVVESKEGEKELGGHIKTMAWDPSGSRLAVIFCGDSKFGVQQHVVLFNTQIKPIFEISLCGFIGGQSSEFPLTVAFSESFDKGALLNVCWSSGVLSQIPLFFHLNKETFGATVTNLTTR